MELNEAKQILEENEYLLTEGVREATNRIYELCDMGTLSWEQVGQAALQYMSEDDVADMARSNEWFSDDEDEDLEESTITEGFDLVDFACQKADELGLRVVDYKTEKEFNYIPENGNTVINAGYTKNGNVYLRKDNKGNTIFYKVTTEDDVVRGLKDFIAYHSSKEYI